MDAARSSTDITAPFSDIHQRTAPAPRKRTRFAPAKPAARQSAPNSMPKGHHQSSKALSRSSNPSASSPTSSAPHALVSSSQKPLSTYTRPASAPPNGRPSPPNGLSRSRAASPTARTSNSGASIFERIADAQRAADERPRPDRRFLCGRPALHSMTEFEPSIAVSLFDKGYVRHDGVLSPHAAAVPARVADVLCMPRLPYDYASRMFLTAIELGLLPLEEDLPPECDRKYYDGCLVAEVFDYRGVDQSLFLQHGDVWRKCGTFVRVLLRPDACNHVADVDVLTENLDDDAALSVEAKLLLVEHPQLELDIHHRIPDSEPDTMLCRPPLTRRKRRRGPRPAGCADPPPLSMAALMLIAASDKEQVNYQLRMRHSRVADHSASSVPPSPKTASRPSTPASAASAAAIAQALQKARKLIFSTKPPRATGHPELPKTHGRLRTIRLILPDKTTLTRFRQAKAAAVANGDNPEHVNQTMFQNVSKQGRPVCIMELVSRQGRGCDVALFRGIFGDRARDVNKMSLGSIADANMFMNHFKSIMEKEGYVCIHDGDPQSNSAAMSAQQQQQQQDARRRAAQLLSQQQQAVAAAGGNLSPVSSHATQTLQQRAQAQAQAQKNRQLQFMQQKQTQAAALSRANAIQQRRQLLQQQQLEQQQQRQATYPQNVAHLQQQAVQQRTTAVNKTAAAQNALNVQAAMSVAMASNNARAYSQQLASLPRNRSPAGRLGVPIPPNQVGRGARGGDGSASPGTQLLSHMQQIQMQQDEFERNRMRAGQTRERFRLLQQQQAIAAGGLAASNAIPASALVTPSSQVSPGFQIPGGLLEAALSQSGLGQFKQQTRDGSDAGSVDTAANSRSAKR